MGDISWLKRIRRYGPTFHTDRTILGVLADYMRESDFVAWPSVATIAAETGLSERAVQYRLRRLVDDGWVSIAWRGGGRAKSTRYRVNVELLGVNRAEINGAKTVQDKGCKKGASSAVNGASSALKGATLAPDRLERLERSSSAHEPDTLPLVVGVRRADDDEPSEATSSAQALPVADELAAAGYDRDNDGAAAPGTYERRLAIRTAFEGVIGKPSRPLRMAVVAALDAGWHASDLNKHLHRAIDQQGGLTKIGNVGGYCRTVLDNLDTPPERIERPAWCGECDERTRLVDFDGDHPRRCPSCNPLAATG